MIKISEVLVEIMGDNDRELGQIQQNLDNTIKNIDILRSDIAQLFSKIEIDSKSSTRDITAIYEEVKLHINTTKEKRDQCNDSFNLLYSKFTELEKDFNQFKLDYIIFETEIKTRINGIKTFASLITFIATIISIVSMIISFK